MSRPNRHRECLRQATSALTCAATKSSWQAARSVCRPPSSGYCAFSFSTRSVSSVLRCWWHASGQRAPGTTRLSQTLLWLCGRQSRRTRYTRGASCMCRRTAISSFLTQLKAAPGRRRARVEASRRDCLLGETPAVAAGALGSSDVEPIAETAHSHYPTRVTGLGLDLSPQPVDMGLDDVPIVPVVAPDAA